MKNKIEESGMGWEWVKQMPWGMYWQNEQFHAEFCGYPASIVVSWIDWHFKGAASRFLCKVFDHAMVDGDPGDCETGPQPDVHCRRCGYSEQGVA